MWNIARKIVTWLIQKDTIKESERELYEYAVYSSVLLIAPLFMAVSIGLMFGEFTMIIVLILPFMIIRKFSGGYHAKSLGRCFVLSNLLLVAGFYVAQRSFFNVTYTVVVILAAVSLAHFSPVDSENRKLTREEYLSYRHTSRKLVILFVVFYLFLLAIGLHKSASFWGMGIILPAVLQIPYILQRSLLQRE